MKVLISAYACEPGKGSEPGVGWSWSLAAAERHDVWVLTRSNNRGAIEHDLARDPHPSLHFVYIDFPPRMRAWKRGRLGLRVYYVLWQLLAAREARRLQREHDFDVVHHVTFANLWLPALACLAGPPFVLGPVGGGQKVPLRLYRALGPISALQELVLLGARSIVRFSPLTRIAWRRAAVILVNNEETRNALPARHRGKAVLRPHACAENGLAGRPRLRGPELVAVYAGRLNRFKAVELALRALTLGPEWKLVIVGDGPDTRRLQKLARKLGVAGQVRFEPWLSQEALWRTMSECRALLFPSLKEGAPFIVAEAQSLGLPVVAFDRGGVAALADIPGTSFELVPGRAWRESIQGLAEALRRVEQHGRTPTDPDLGLDGVARDLDTTYRRVCASRTADGMAVA